jgi:hypothetical protein
MVPGVRILAVLCLVCSACASIEIVRVKAPEPSESAPRIGQLVDLGGLALPEEGRIEPVHSDGAYTPGEWVAALGDSLGDAVKVSVGGVDTPVAGHLKGGGLLFRLPRTPRSGRRVELAVTTSQGTASKNLVLSRTLLVSDPDGHKVHFLVEGPEISMLDGPVEQVELEWARMHTISPSGALAHIIQYPSASIDSKTNKTYYNAEVVAVHLGAAGGPAALGRFRVKLNNPPTSIAHLDEGTLLVLAERELFTVDVSRPGQGQVLGSLILPIRANPGTTGEQDCLHAEVAGLPGKKAVVLEVHGNSLLLIDLGDPQRPNLVATLKTAGDVDLPLSIDLAADADDPGSVWLLQGPNFRIASEKLRRATDKLKAGVLEKLYPAAAYSRKTEATAPGPEATGVSRLVRYKLDGGTLAAVEGRGLPKGFYPLFAKSLPGGDLWVSGVNSHVFDFAGVTASLEGMKRVVKILGDSVSFGRIVKVPRSGQPTTLIQGPALYFNLDDLPGTGVAHTVLRVGVKLLPPGLSVDFGVELQEKGFVRLRRLDWKALIPPYSFGLLGLQ